MRRNKHIPQISERIDWWVLPQTANDWKFFGYRNPLVTQGMPVADGPGNVFRKSGLPTQRQGITMKPGCGPPTSSWLNFQRIDRRIAPSFSAIEVI